jgi:hypothetical protein
MKRRLALVLGLVVALGCTDGKPPGDLPALHPARGKVVRNGQPVGGGMVRFFAQPDDPDLVVNAEVGADGAFELQTLHAQSQKKAKGAPAGTYQVTYYPPAGDQTQGPSPEPVSPSQPQTIQAGNNELTVEVGRK